VPNIEYASYFGEAVGSASAQGRAPKAIRGVGGGSTSTTTASRTDALGVDLRVHRRRDRAQLPDQAALPPSWLQTWSRVQRCVGGSAS
jgi:hypothetical protein